MNMNGNSNLGIEKLLERILAELVRQREELGRAIDEIVKNTRKKPPEVVGEERETE
jgi:hypothetical protein